MMRNINDALQLSFSTSVISNVFQAAPESLTNTTPDSERSRFQNFVASASDVATTFVAGALVSGDIKPAPATIALSTLAITKGFTLKDKQEGETEKKDCSKEIVRNIASATTVGVMGAAARNKLNISNSADLHVPALVGGLFIIPLIKKARIPGEPQVAPEDRSWKQVIGHGLVNSAVGAGIALSALVALSPTVIAVGLIGGGTAIIANTIIGKKREEKPVEELEEKHCSYRR